MTLKDLNIGETAVVGTVGGEGALRQHFLDMGLIPGEEVTLVKFAPMGDPMELSIHGYELTLRLDDAARIGVTLAKAPAAKFNPLTVEDILAARQAVLNVHMSEAIEEYLVQLIVATRHPEKYDAKLAGQVLYGASPRATIALDRCAKINAWIDGRDFVTPEDIHAVIYDILRHRIILSFEAQAEGVTADGIIEALLRIVPLP